MIKLKSNNPKITFRPSEKLRQRFRKFCFMRNVTQDKMLNNLIYRLVNGKIKTEV